MRSRLLFVLAIACIGAPLAWLYHETGLMQVVGVDISHHQKQVNWESLKRVGVAFAYVKATEGGDYVDDRFAQNWRQSGAAGMRRGAYHYFRQCRSGEAQARNFVAAAPSEPHILPPVVDVEDMETCGPAAGVAPPAVEVTKFLNFVEAHFGCRPIVYTTLEYERTFLAGELQGERFWVRSLFLPPSFRTGSWLFWQYHNAGRREGVDGPVDLNAFRGTATEFDRFVADAGCGKRSKVP